MDLRETITELKTFTRDYMESHGHSFNDRNLCRCPSPDHEDENPSCGFVPGTYILHCFSCLWSGDLFHLANWFESYPTHGKEFLTTTMPRLCEQFSIPYETPELTEQDRYRLDAFQAYKDAATVLISYPVSDAIKERGWDERTCNETFTGCVSSWDDFVERMRKLGYSASYLKSIDITSAIFDSHNITFTWTNAWGAPIGFSARDTRYVDGTVNPPNLKKYHNTSAKCPIFQKGSLLYGFHWARKLSPLFITEGFPDVVTAYKHGIKNIVCLGGTALTKDHARLLREAHVTDVVLALNPDEAGNVSTAKQLDEGLSGEAGVRVRVLNLEDTVPGHKDDIDNFFKYNDGAKEKWLALEPEDAFKWRLKHFPPEADQAIVVDKALKLVVNEKSNVRREDMTKVLAEHTGYSVEAVQRDLDRLTFAERQQVQEQTSEISNGLLRKLRSAPAQEQIDQIIEAGKSAEDLRSRAIGSAHDPLETREFMDTMCALLLNPATRPRGFMSGWSAFDQAFHGIPKQGRFIGIAGEPSSGKTSFVHQLIMKFLQNAEPGTKYEENKGILVLLFTTDDSRHVVIPRLMSIDSNLPTTDKILAPEMCNEQEMKVWTKARERIQYYIQHKYLDVRDAAQGITLDYFEDWIRFAQSKNKDKQILAVLDNFHKLEGFGADDRVKYKGISQRIHKLKTQLGVTFICTMELIKTHGRDVRPDDIAETKKILYDCDALVHIHSDWQEHLTDTGAFWINEFGVRKPTLRVRVWKNKITSKLPTMWYDIDPETSRFTERTEPPDGVALGRLLGERAALHKPYVRR